MKVPYERERGDLQRVYLGISRDTRTPPKEWKAACGDTDTDHARCRPGRHRCRRQLVVCWWFPVAQQGVVWVKDRDGARPTRVVA